MCVFKKAHRPGKNNVFIIRLLGKELGFAGLRKTYFKQMDRKCLLESLLTGVNFYQPAGHLMLTCASFLEASVLVNAARHCSERLRQRRKQGGNERLKDEFSVHGSENQGSV